MLRASKVLQSASAPLQFQGATRAGYRILQDWSDPASGRFIALAQRDNKQYVLKYLQKSIFTQAVRIGSQLHGCRFVRTHVDTVAEEGTVVYEHMTSSLFDLVQKFTIPLSQCKRILHDILHGLQEMHSRNVVHTDLKPNNVMVDYTTHGDGRISISKVKVADVDDAVILVQRQAIAVVVGNVWWRSPEAELGTRVRAPADVFSFGLVCAFVLLGRPILYIDEQARVPDVDLEYQVLDRTMEYFGPFPASLKEHASDVQRQVLSIIEVAFTGPEMYAPFQHWGKKHLPPTAADLRLDFLEDRGFKRIMDKAMKMEPAERASVDELLADPWWET